ncbi:MAG: flagellar hook-associated protein FlgK [Clostridia bacterium]|nr:flagellar hook-associated protein FlgK [Clostridia bacterium]
MRSTFGGFYVARSGLDAARSNIETTGNNITNANSIGYTRQRLDTYAVGSYRGTMRYSTNASNIGEGVKISGTSQIRDPYLDVRYRAEAAKLGSTGAQSDALADLGYIFDSATDTEFDTQFSDFVKQLQALAESPSDPVTENIVKTSATTILQLFRQYSSQLDTVKGQTQTEFTDGAVETANLALQSIAELNKSIRTANISGNPALELVDERNTFIDQLSQYLNVEVTTKDVDVGSGVTVQELSVNFTTSNGDKFNLVNNDEYRQFEVTETNDGDFGLTLTESNGTLVDSSEFGSISLTGGDFTDQVKSGAFYGYLTMLNDKGEFDTPQTTQRGIPYYEQMLDSIANKFAQVLNDANSTVDEDKPLFEPSVAGDRITASNISISEAWTNSTGKYITNSKQSISPGLDNDDDSSNILFIISQFKADLTFESDSGMDVFKGSFQECISNISTTLGLQIKGNQRLYETNETNINEVDYQRQSVSGVSLDEEGINLIMYNQALTASSRFMTTLDEALETIITSMGLVGR